MTTTPNTAPQAAEQRAAELAHDLPGAGDLDW